MAGRFPLFTDACVNGHLVEALIQHGWDLVRAIDLYAERTPDTVLFERAAQEGRVFVSNDGPIERLARSWLIDRGPSEGLARTRPKSAPSASRRLGC